MGKMYFVILLVIPFIITSCATHRKNIYLQNLQTNESYDIGQRRKAVIQAGDRVKINVNCKNMELAIPFNQKSYQIGTNGDVNGENAIEMNTGYLVDDAGNIEFPILGKIKVEGLTLSELSALIKSKIASAQYIPDPTVTTDFMNFKVYMMGALNHVGPITVNDGSLTLLQAISEAGDLNNKARLNKIKVIREINGKRMMYEVDIRNKNIYSSPAYYLQQNDIVYVESKGKDAYEKGFHYANIATTLASFILTLVWIFRR